MHSAGPLFEILCFAMLLHLVPALEKETASIASKISRVGSFCRTSRGSKVVHYTLRAFQEKRYIFCAKINIFCQGGMGQYLLLCDS